MGKSRKGKGGFARDSKQIEPENVHQAIDILVLLDQFKKCGHEIHLYEPITQTL